MMNFLMVNGDEAVKTPNPKNPPARPPEDPTILADTVILDWNTFHTKLQSYKGTKYKIQ